MAADVTVGTVSVQLKLINTITGTQNANPLYGTYAPGDSSRLYLIQQGTVDANPDIQGKLLYINPATVGGAVNTLIDFNVKLPGMLDITHFEKGFLAVAFHPDFNLPGTPGYLKFYTYSNENYAASAAADRGVASHPQPASAELDQQRRHAARMDGERDDAHRRHAVARPDANCRPTEPT
jgi:hypothetical protein